MSKYTTEVRYICENYAGKTESVDYNDVEDVIELSRNQIFNDYPIFDENYRETLETKILMHYYTKEIGFETVGLWKLKLATKMNEIMPYYNQLYKSELLEFNPLYDVDISRTRVRNENNDSKQNNSGSIINASVNKTFKNDENISVRSNDNKMERGNKNIDKYSDTPQGALTGMEDVEDNLYLTNARIITDNENQKDHNTENNIQSGQYNDETNRNDNTVTNNDMLNKINTTENYLEYVQGKNGGKSYSELIKEYRQTFLNIDKMVIEELSDLFMNIW